MEGFNSLPQLGKIVSRQSYFQRRDQESVRAKRKWQSKFLGNRGILGANHRNILANQNVTIHSHREHARTHARTHAHTHTHTHTLLSFKAEAITNTDDITASRTVSVTK